MLGCEKATLMAPKVSSFCLGLKRSQNIMCEMVGFLLASSMISSSSIRNINMFYGRVLSILWSISISFYEN